MMSKKVLNDEVIDEQSMVIEEAVVSDWIVDDEIIVTDESSHDKGIVMLEYYAEEQQDYNLQQRVEEDSTTYYVVEEEKDNQQAHGPHSNLKDLTARLANRCHGSHDSTPQPDEHNQVEYQQEVLSDPYVVFHEDVTLLEEDIVHEGLEEEEGVAAYCDVRCEDVMMTSSLEEVVSADDESLQNFSPVFVYGRMPEASRPGQNANLYHCSHCPKTFYQRNYWKNHIKSHSEARPFKCGTCDKSFKKVGDMDRHEKLCQLEDSRPFKCDQCGKKFSLSNSLSNHIKMHSDKKPFSCQHCSMSFKKGGSKNSHERICVSGELPYACAVCHRKFPAANNLANHVLVHAGVVALLSCSVCGKSFKKPGSHKTHEEKCKQGISHTCQICSKEFASELFMTRHLKTHGDSSEKQFRCEECGKSFTHQNGFTNHLKSHIGLRNDCSYPECGRTFSSVKELKEHESTHKTDNKNHDCEICGRHFNDSWNCKRHKQTHNPLKPFLCPLCGRKFSSQKDMESHSVTHTGEKLWKCSLCACSFTHLRGLQGHMNLHTDRAKACGLGCGKVFPTQSALKQHVQKCKLNTEADCIKTNKPIAKKLGKWAYEPLKTLVSGKGSGSSPKVVFRCKLCDKRFENYAGIQEHIQIHKSTKDSTDKVKDEVVISIEVVKTDQIEDFETSSKEELVISQEEFVNSPNLNGDTSVDDEVGETLDTIIVIEDL